MAAGVSGPGRLRYGGLRDFILGIRFVDGAGDEIRGGGKVVKNSAGFDLPKLFVGSCGWLGMLTEVTLKVFPLSSSRKTVCFEIATTGELVKSLERLTTRPFELDALEFMPRSAANGAGQLFVRMAGEEGAIEAHREKLVAALEIQPSEISDVEVEAVVGRAGRGHLVSYGPALDQSAFDSESRSGQSSSGAFARRSIFGWGWPAS